MSGVLRLASKYVIESLRTRALAHLSVAWPSTLKGWDAREELAANSANGRDEARYPNPVVREGRFLASILSDRLGRRSST